MKVGQTVYLLRNEWGRKPNELEETKVHFIGRKYVYFEYDKNKRFCKESLKQAFESNYHDKIYLEKQAYYNEIKAEKLSNEIRKLIGNYGIIPLPLAQLRIINNILQKK